MAENQLKFYGELGTSFFLDVNDILHIEYKKNELKIPFDDVLELVEAYDIKLQEDINAANKKPKW